MGQLVDAQPRRQPLGGECVHGVDDQGLLLALGKARIRLAQQVERFGGPWGQPLAGLTEGQRPRLPQKERRAEPLLEQLDLVAHRRLGHPQLRRSLRETHKAC